MQQPEAYPFNEMEVIFVTAVGVPFATASRAVFQ